MPEPVFIPSIETRLTQLEALVQQLLRHLDDLRRRVDVLDDPTGRSGSEPATDG